MLVLLGLPVIMARYVLRLSESEHVLSTGGMLVELIGLYLLITLVLLMGGVLLKTWRELLLRRRRAPVGVSEVLSTLERHLRILTPRGWMVLMCALFFVVLSVSLSWAALGVMATLCTLLFYGMLGILSVTTAFQLHELSTGLARQQARIHREISPAVVLAGDDAEERFHLEQVPVPLGLSLIIEDINPPRLQSSTRHALGARFLGRDTGNCTVSGRVRCTPRGLHRLGPARISYRDALGLARFPVASWATTELKVLPRFKPLEVEDAPTSVIRRPDVITRLHRFATEDPFRFKEYGPGDDTRRIHWRLSVRTGQLQVRVPESRETNSRHVLLLLDSWMDPTSDLQDAVGMGRILDDLVETWLALAAELVHRGDRVSLVAAVDDGAGRLVVESVDGREDRRRWQDLGSRAGWQGVADLPKLLESASDEITEAVAVSSRLRPAPMNLTGPHFTWIYHPPQLALGPPIGLLSRLFGLGWRAPFRTLDFLFRMQRPPGSLDNALVLRLRENFRQLALHSARYRLAWTAASIQDHVLESFIMRGEAVYTLQPGAAAHQLVRVSESARVEGEA
jgi:uncharacterized protein (DUF58 family)